MGLNYKEAGVDKEAGYREVQLIKEHVARTKRRERCRISAVFPSSNRT